MRCAVWFNSLLTPIRRFLRAQPWKRFVPYLASQLRAQVRRFCHESFLSRFIACMVGQSALQLTGKILQYVQQSSVRTAVDAPRVETAQRSARVYQEQVVPDVKFLQTRAQPPPAGPGNACQGLGASTAASALLVQAASAAMYQTYATVLWSRKLAAQIPMVGAPAVRTWCTSARQNARLLLCPSSAPALEP
eukprot:COSAG04_NODE_8827_length_927_cov_0.925121_1_plen_191_part_01